MGGRRRGRQCDRPPHKGAPGPGRSVGALVPAPCAGSHPPAGVCASVHRNAGSEGACRSRAAGAGGGGTEGREGARPQGRGAKASRSGRRRTGYGPRGWGRGRQPGSADRRAPLRAPRAPRARLRTQRAGGGRGAGGGGAGERGGGSDPGLQPAPETRCGPGDPQEVCNGPPTTRTELAAEAVRRRCGPTLLLQTRDHELGLRSPTGVGATITSAFSSGQHPPSCHTPQARGPRCPSQLRTAPPKRQDQTLQDPGFARRVIPVLTR